MTAVCTFFLMEDTPIYDVGHNVFFKLPSARPSIKGPDTLSDCAVRNAQHF